jgi:hypothetical protein
VIGVITALWTAKSWGWHYISLPTLSGLPRESVVLSGFVAACSASWIAYRYTAAGSLLTPVAGVRVRTVLPLRTLVLAGGWWCGFYCLGAAVGILPGLLRADGGVFYPSELTIGLGILLTMTCLGFAVGTAVPRWHTVLLALAASVTAIGVLPIVYGATLAKFRRDGGSEFLFVWAQSLDHQRFVYPMWAVIICWWFILAASLALVGLSQQRLKTGGSRVKAAIAVAAVCAVTVGGIALGSVDTPTLALDQPTAPVCVDGSFGVPICVAQEEAPLLPAIADAAERVAQRAGTWPESLKVVATRRGARSAGYDPNATDSEVVEVPAALTGRPPLEREVAANLGGLRQCGTRPISETALDWSFALSLWFAQDPDFLDQVGGGLPSESLRSAPDNAIRAWYAANVDALTNCSYDGQGPQ